MDQPIANTSQAGKTVDSNAVILSLVGSGLERNTWPEAEIATVRQMMETLFARMEALQQNQAVQLAGVHDRLDAVELEIPLIQEQSALRMRDLEARMTSEIDEAARTAAEEAASSVTAALREDVAGKFGSLAAQVEAQHKELSQIRESKRLADTRLNRAIQDIERLCGNLGPLEEEAPLSAQAGPAPSRFHSRLAQHIRKGAVDFAPGEENPPMDGLLHNRAGTAPAPLSLETGSPSPARGAPGGPLAALPPAARPVPAPSSSPSFDGKPGARVVRESQADGAASSPPVPDVRPPAGETKVPGFDAWKRQFMQEGEPLIPVLTTGSDKADRMVVCPRCYSVRTRPATFGRLDHIFRLARYTPHRCRSCAHRFYKRVGPGYVAPTEDPSDPWESEAMETR